MPNKEIKNNEAGRVTSLFLKYMPDLFEEGKCPICHKSLLILRYRLKAIRLAIRCLHCGLYSDDEEELKDFGIETEIEM